MASENIKFLNYLDSLHAPSLEQIQTRKQFPIVVSSFDHSVELKLILEKLGYPVIMGHELFGNLHSPSVTGWTRNAFNQLHDTLVLAQCIDPSNITYALLPYAQDIGGDINKLKIVHSPHRLHHGGMVLYNKQDIVYPQGHLTDADLNLFDSIESNAEKRLKRWAVPPIQKHSLWRIIQNTGRGHEGFDLSLRMYQHRLTTGGYTVNGQHFPDLDMFMNLLTTPTTYQNDIVFFIDEMMACDQSSLMDYIVHRFGLIFQIPVNEAMHHAANFFQLPDKTVLLPGPSPKTAAFMRTHLGVNNVVEFPWEWCADGHQTGALRCRTNCIDLSVTLPN